MQLSKLAYTQFGNDPREWTLEPVEFQQINLIVGRNSSGKSRTLNVINGLANLISGRNQQMMGSGEFDVTFREGSVDWMYFLRLEDKLVTLERLPHARCERLHNDNCRKRCEAGFYFRRHSEIAFGI